MHGVRPTTLARQGYPQCASTPIAPHTLIPTSASAPHRYRDIPRAGPDRLITRYAFGNNSTAPRLGRVKSTRDSQHGPPCKDSPACFIDFADSDAEDDGNSSQPPPGRPGNISSGARDIPLTAAFAKRKGLWTKAGSHHCPRLTLPKGIRGNRMTPWFSVLWLLMSFAALSTATDKNSVGNGHPDRRRDAPRRLPLRAWKDMTTEDFQAMMKDDSIEPIAVLQVRRIPLRPASSAITSRHSWSQSISLHGYEF